MPYWLMAGLGSKPVYDLPLQTCYAPAFIPGCTQRERREGSLCMHLCASMTLDARLSYTCAQRFLGLNLTRIRKSFSFVHPPPIRCIPLTRRVLRTYWLQLFFAKGSTLTSKSADNEEDHRHRSRGWVGGYGVGARLPRIGDAGPNGKRLLDLLGFIGEFDGGSCQRGMAEVVLATVSLILTICLDLRGLDWRKEARWGWLRRQ